MASNEKCGNVFLSNKGITIFHCVLCGSKYDEIQNFGIHIIEKHYTLDQDFEADDLMPYISDIMSEQSDSNLETLSDFSFETDEENAESNITSPTKINETGRAEDDEYDEQCGEVELTPEGILIFCCSLCDNQYEGIGEFDQHISDHYSTEVLEDVQFEMLWPENDKDNTNFVPSDEIEANINFDCLIDESQCNNESLSNEGRKISQSTKAHEDQKSKKPIAKWRQVFETIRCSITNAEKYKCKLCGVVINYKTNTTHHIKRVHEKSKPHKCSECPQRYHSKTELRIHFRKHTGERPYLCMECGVAFVSASMLHKHRQLKHKRRARDKICPICGKSFFTTKHLHAHRSVHSEERPFKCDICSAEFKYKTTLKTHMRSHEDERLYKCNLCPAAYNYKSLLTSHMKSKHDLALEKT